MDVVFFHGLQFNVASVNDAWKNTWLQHDCDEICWPKYWLPSNLHGKVCVLSLSYDAHVQDSIHNHVSDIV